MSKLSLTSRTFTDAKSKLINLTNTYYPNISTDMNDASIGSWFIDIVSGISDDLNYHLDRVYQETNINTAQQTNSIYDIARTNGLKIPGPKGAMTEVEFSCVLPVNGNISNSSSTIRVPNWEFAPIIKKSTKVSGSGVVFEVMNDINFSEQFDENGISNRTIIPIRDSNGLITSYRITKLGVVVAGESNIYTKVINESDILPFMEITIPSDNVMNIESIIFKNGTDYQIKPTINEFMLPNEVNLVNDNEIYRYFEVESLIDDTIWSDSLNIDNEPDTYTYGYEDNGTIIPTYSITKGEWKVVNQKFITEFTDKGYLKIIFGNGIDDNTNIDDASDFSKFQISKLINNNSLGVLPPGDTTMFVLYRSGGGLSSNVAKGAINNITFFNIEFNSCIKDENDRVIVTAIQNSLTVTNTIPSVSGKDMPTTNELKYMIKYNNSSQNRCVTVKDYYNRILQLPARYGTPFRVGVGEANNKIMINLLGINYLGQLTNELPNVLVENIINYLNEYKMITDYVEIKSGKIINLSFDVDLYVDKNYNKSDVIVSVINTLQEYMDINNHLMGDDVFMGDIQRKLSELDGVLNIIDIRVYNEYGDGYSSTQSSQAGVVSTSCDITNNLGGEDNVVELDKFQIDTYSSDGILYTEADTMFEIKYPQKDIRVRVKTR